MATLPPEIIARVKDETDIVELVGKYVRLQAAGASYKGLCPFHQEKTPSFHVNPVRQLYKCFGCGAGGDAIAFLMEIEGLAFPEAMETLARALDIDLAKFLQPGEDEGEKRAYFRAMAAAADAFCAAWQDPHLGAAARDYLTGRGFSLEILDRFDVGWAPAGDWLQRELERRGVGLELALSSDLLRTHDGRAPFAYFRERVMFPIRNVARQVTGFGARIIGAGEPKYLNSADSPHFSKSRLLYGFDAARMVIARVKEAVLVEGYLDVIALAQAGVTHAVASCGTAFTAEQARLLRRGADRVVVLFDGDAAGRKAAVKTCHICLAAGLEAEIAALPQGRDPADVALEDGPDAVAAVLANRVPYLRFVRDAVARAGDDRAALEKGVRQVLTTVAAVPDAIRREYMLREVADLFELETAVLRASLPRDGAPVRPVTTAGDDAEQEPAAPKETAPRRPTFRKLTGVHAEAVEAVLLAHVLRDASGRAARLLLSEIGDLPLSHPAARILLAELADWAVDGAGLGPAAHIQARWHAHDGAYRAYVTDLLDKDIPEGGETERAVRESLERLRLARRAHHG
ncbi:MAG: DNA primase [Candidatus Krumholzibacteriia bacterium]